MSTTDHSFARWLWIAAWLIAATLVANVAHAEGKAGNATRVHPVQIPDSTQWNMTSTSSGRTFRIFVAWPLRKSKPPKGGYPVVYVLDGNSMFATVVQQSRREAQARELKPAIIVGIGYPTDDPGRIDQERIFDLSLPANPATLPPMARGAKTGGADEFTDFILHELEPQIAAKFPVDRNDRILMGHSLAGLFVLNVLFNHPGSFRSYVAISPSIWFNDRTLLRREPAFAKTIAKGEFAPRVLLLVGGLEQTPPPSSRLPPGFSEQQVAKLVAAAKMVDNVRTLGAQLSALHGKSGYTIRTDILPNQTHNSEVPAALSLGLGFALQP